MAHRNLGHILYMSGRYDEALVAFRRAVELMLEADPAAYAAPAHVLRNAAG